MTCLLAKPCVKQKGLFTSFSPKEKEGVPFVEYKIMERQVNAVKVNFGEYLICDEKDKIQIDRVFDLLSGTYWAKDRGRDIIEKSIENSICFGIYINGNQVGFARCVTDFATVYWLADVIIDNGHRNLGLGKALVKAVVEHEQLKDLAGILATKDAHGLYEQYGFQLNDGRFMRRPRYDS